MQADGAAHAAAIEFDGLSKRYWSGALALNGLTLTVPRGEIFGFLGPNGAGKSTTIRLMLDLIRPTSGSVRIFGKDCNDGKPDVRRHVGYLPGDLSLYGGMTSQATFDLFASLRPGQVRRKWVQELADRLSLDLDVKVRQLSHGNKQKVGIVLALMAEPDLLVLDEPTSGLDPLAQREVLEVLREVRDRGATVFFSSHILPEVQRISDRVGMIRKGELVDIQRIDELLSRRLTELTVQFAQAPPGDAFAGIEGVHETARGDEGSEVHLEAAGDLDALIKAIARYEVIAIESMQPSLEEAFMTLYDIPAELKEQR